MRRFVTLQVGLMMFLASLALAGALAFGAVLDHWTADASGTLTIQVPVAATPTVTAERVAQVSRTVRSLPGVASAEPLSDAALTTLMSRWLGPGLSAGDLPLPRLIAVHLAEGVMLDTDSLEKQLAVITPGVSIDAHRQWLNGVIAGIAKARLLAWVMVGLIAIATAATVVHAVAVALAVDQEEIEILHLLGAEDTYISRTYANAAQKHGVIGALAGVVAALAVLKGLVGTGGADGLLPSLDMPIVVWLAPLGLPVATALLARLVATIAVRRHLLRRL